MYYEKPREYEEFEDICDVRGFEQAEDSGKFDCRIGEDDIQCCSTNDNVDCVDIDQTSYSKGCCNNHAEFIISSFQECYEEEPCIEQCKCNVEEKCNAEERYNIEEKCNAEEKYNIEEKCNVEEKYNIEEKCNVEENYNYYNKENCLENYECKPKKHHKKPRKRPCMEYQKGMQVGYRMGYMKAQQEFRRRIMYMYNMFQCR